MGEGLLLALCEMVLRRPGAPVGMTIEQCNAVPVAAAETQSLAELVRDVVRTELANSVMPVVDAQVSSLTLTRSNVERIVSSIDDRIDARLQSSRDSIFELIAAQNAHLSVFTAAITRQLDGMQLSLGRVAAPAVVVDSATADIVMGNVV